MRVEEDVASIAKLDPEIKKRRELYDSRKSDRAVWEEHWDDIAAYIAPRKVGFRSVRTPGEKRRFVTDTTGIHSNELLAAGLHGMATNPATKWFSLKMTDDDLNDNDEVKLWLSAVEKVMRSRMYAPGTNIVVALHESYLDLGSFGTSPIFIGQQRNGGLLFQARSLAECVIAENVDGAIDELDRCTEYRVGHLMQMAASAGWKPSRRVEELASKGKLDEKVEVIHSVHPRPKRNTDRKDSRNMAFASVYYEKEACHLLSEGGFPEFPYTAARWSKVANELYGRSVGMTALPDVKLLQKMVITTLKAAEKIADPPWFLPDDSVVGPVKTIPGGLNYYRGNREIFQFPTSSSGLPITEEMIESLRNRIRNTFHADVLQLVDQREMTLGEARMRLSERMRLLGPQIGRLESEELGPMVNRVFGILLREDAFPPVPEILQGKEFTVEYVSPIATAQKQEEAAGIMTALQYVAALGPEAALQIIQSNIHGERLVKHLWDLFNNDPKLLLTEAEKQANAENEARMQNMASTVPMADAAQKGSAAVKNLADANAGGGIDLSRFSEALAAAQRAGAAA